MLIRIALLVLCSTAVVQATAVVVFRTPERIVLAADSLLYSTPPELTCKIRQAGRWFTLTGGFMRAENPTLDVQAELVAAVSPATSFAEVKAAVMGTVYPRIERVLTLSSAQSSIAAQHKAGNTLASYVVAGQDGAGQAGVGLRAGILVVHLRTLDPVTLSAQWLECPGAWCEAAGTSVYWAASVAGPAVDRILERPRRSWVQRGDSAAARRLISEQLAATPDLVRAPVDVLEITAAGAKWIARDTASLCSPTTGGHG